MPAQQPGLVLPKREADPSHHHHLRLLLRPPRRPGPGCRSSSSSSTACRSPPLAPSSLLLPEPPHAVGGGEERRFRELSSLSFLSSPRLRSLLSLSLLRTAGSSSPHFPLPSSRLSRPSLARQLPPWAPAGDSLQRLRRVPQREGRRRESKQATAREGARGPRGRRERCWCCCYYYDYHRR